VSQSQVSAAQNQLSQAQQGLNASQASIDTAVQQVATAKQQVDSAKQQVIAAQTEVDTAQKNLDVANRELKRTAKLFEENVYSRLTFEQAKDTVDQAQIALRNAQSRLQSQKLAVNEANARVNEANARVNEARARARQQEVAVKDARRGVDTANLSVNSTQSRANQQSALLRGQQNQRNKTLQIAPINGVIAEIPSKVGTFAVASLSSTALMTIADMSTVNVEVKVDETEIDKVEVGQSAKIKVDALGDKEIAGEVTQKTPLALGKSQTSGGLSTNINIQEAKEFRVVIQLKQVPDEIHKGLRPGMSATATITTKTVENVIAVPLQAVIEKQPEAAPSPAIANSVPTPGADKPKPIKGVYILENNKVKFVEVTTGITGESDIQITSGLAENQDVITGPSRVLKTLKDNDIVKKQTKSDAANANKS
jgi:HlyD family secretion protein